MDTHDSMLVTSVTQLNANVATHARAHTQHCWWCQGRSASNHNTIPPQSNSLQRRASSSTQRWCVHVHASYSSTTVCESRQAMGHLCCVQWQQEHSHCAAPTTSHLLSPFRTKNNNQLQETATTVRKLTGCSAPMHSSRDNLAASC